MRSGTIDCGWHCSYKVTAGGRLSEQNVIAVLRARDAVSDFFYFFFTFYLYIFYII